MTTPADRLLDVDLNEILTEKQRLAIHLYYVEGQSYRRIGKALGIAGPSAYELVCRGRDRIITYCVGEGDPNASPYTEVLPSSGRSSNTADAAHAASRQDELLDQLDARIEQRATELATIEDCMSGDSILRTHIKRNTFDRWEMIVMAERGCNTLATSAYEARRLMRFIPDAQA